MFHVSTWNLLLSHFEQVIPEHLSYKIRTSHSLSGLSVIGIPQSSKWSMANYLLENKMFVGCIWCAVSPDIPSVKVSRVFQGFGTSALQRYSSGRHVWDDLLILLLY